MYWYNSDELEVYIGKEMIKMKKANPFSTWSLDSSQVQAQNVGGTHCQ